MCGRNEPCVAERVVTWVERVCVCESVCALKTLCMLFYTAVALAVATAVAVSIVTVCAPWPCAAATPLPDL